jgi:hypothetical protein
MTSFASPNNLDTLLTVAQICPVEVLEIDRTIHKTEIVVTPLEESDRNALAQSLNLAAPSEQLRDWFRLGAEPVTADDEDDPDRDAYSLLDRRTITGDAGGTDWNFVEARPHASGPRYIFSAPGNPIVRTGRFYLARNHSGTLAQIRRRHKAIDDLRSHESLLRFLSDPQSFTKQLSDPLPPPKVDISLDQSKLEALERLWSSNPSFAIQGPPRHREDNPNPSVFRSTSFV